MSRRKITAEQAIDAFKRYQDGETIKNLAKQLEVSSTLIGQMRKEFGRVIRVRIAYMVSLALQCGCSMDEITKSIEWGLQWYEKDSKADNYELLKKSEASNRFDI
jgi:hypothetical protein